MTEVRKQMHQTTVRFDSELWRRIDAEAARMGVSAAQYVRDSTLIRLTNAAHGSGSGEHTGPMAVAPLHWKSVMSTSGETITESQAVWAQARQARERARVLRESSRRLSEARAVRAAPGDDSSPPRRSPKDPA